MAHSPMDGGGNGKCGMVNKSNEQMKKFTTGYKLGRNVPHRVVCVASGTQMVTESGHSPGEGWEFIGINDQGYWIWKKIV
jgi:hypothetical protein